MQGFTIAETLIVLLVVTSFIFIPVLASAPLQKKIEIEQFFAVFEKRFLACQQAAITGMLPTNILIDKTSIYFKTQISTGIKWSLLEIPDELSYTGVAKITFAMSSGNNSSLSKMKFYWKNQNKTVSYQMQLGSGRYIKKIE
ncbi:competence protein ComGD [Enterococcus sp. AZ194]